MAHNFRSEVRKLNLITSLRPNGSASGRMAHLLQDFQFDAGNPFFISKNLRRFHYYLPSGFSLVKLKTSGRITGKTTRNPPDYESK